MNDILKEQIASKLYEKGVNLPCPRCNSVDFEIVGQTRIPLNENNNNIIIGGPAVNAVIIACSHCGFITLHALSSLEIKQQ